MAEWQGNEESQRLRRVYQDMSEGELMGLSATAGDLTPPARAALTTELEARGLAGPVDEDVESPEGEVGLPTAADVMPENLGATGPEMELTVFYDAMAAGRACEFLEAAGIPFHVADLADKGNLGTLEGGPAVVLRITVPLPDVERARAILRKKMGLFPLQEVEASDALEDDGTRTAVGYFGGRDDAEEIAAVLSGAGFANWVVENPEGSEADENRFAVEVREVDLFAAGEAVDKALGVEE